MSVRLIQYCSKPGWKSIIDSLDLLPGPSFEEYQNLSRNKNKLDTTKKLPQNNGTKRTLVVFVGGCTYAEISALRFLSQQVRCLKKYDQFAAKSSVYFQFHEIFVTKIMNLYIVVEVKIS